MRTSPFFVSLMFAVALAGCAKKEPTAPPPPSAQTISGVVRVGGMPLGNAAVGLSGSASALTSTAADGSYSFTGLASGSYLIHVMHPGHSMSPSGHWVDLPGGSSNLDFRLTPTATRFSLTGAISGTGMAGVRMRLSGDNAGNALSLPDGHWSIPNLIIGDYTLTPEKAGYHFSPPSRAIVGNVSFTHPQTGNGTLGSVTLAGVTQIGEDVSEFFEITSPPVDGVGTIRARRASEIATGSIAAYNAMWNAGYVVVVNIAHALGSDTIEIGLGPNPTITVSSTTFVVTQSLTPLNGNDFTALAH
jgi:hypothetical protein